MREDRSILDFLTARDTFLNERLARHYGIAGVTGPEFRRVDISSTAARGRPDAGQRADGLVVCHEDLAGAARQVDSRQPVRRRTATAAARTWCGWTKKGSARRCRCASGWKCTAATRRARPVTAGWTRWGSGSRTSTASARGGRWTANSRSIRPVSFRTGGPSTVRASWRRFSASEQEAFARALTSKLLVYALGRGPEPARQADGAHDCAPPRGRGLPLLEAYTGDRSERPVPDAPGSGARMIVTGRHLPRRTFLKGLGAAVALPMLDAMTPAFAAPAARTADRRGWRSSTSRTASR